jgi:DNA uptake protein ComE-like DNA-binding protein
MLDTSVAARVRRWWWVSVPLWSLGLLAWVPFFRRAISTRQRNDWLLTAGYFAASTAEVVLLAQTESDGGGFLAVMLMAAAAIHTAVLYRRPAAAAVGAADPNTVALAEAAQAGKRRAEARRIVENDPVLARDLRIGRPDLPRTFDDGGVVDANHASAQTLARVLGWTVAEAASIVETRERTGCFSSLAELTAYADVDPQRVDAVADLLVFCRV